jgi:hypothetical protein
MARQRMIPKKLAPAKAGVADFSAKIMRKIKEKACRGDRPPALTPDRSGGY